MGVKTGDKARYNRTRRKKIAQRASMRELRKQWEAKGAPAPAKPA
jgi:hypothetical protein